MYAWLRRIFSNDDAVGAVSAEIADEVAAVSVYDDGLGVSWLQRAEVTACFNHWLFGMRDDADLFISPIEQQVLSLIESTLAQKRAGANLVRRMPGVIPQLLQSLRSDDFSGAELARKISNDVVLVAEVIRLANAAFHTTSGKSIESIEHAVLVVGQNGLRQLISGVAFRPIINLKSGYFTRLVAPRLWLQAEQCALACRLLAEREEVNAFEAFLAGLIQYVGLIVSLRMMEQVAPDDPSLGSESFCNSLIVLARQLSCSIAEEWQFSPAIVRAIEEQGTAFNQIEISPISRILSNADYLSKVHLLKQVNLVPATATSGLSDLGTTCLSTLQQRATAEQDEGENGLIDPGLA